MLSFIREITSYFSFPTIIAHVMNSHKYNYIFTAIHQTQMKYKVSQ